MLRRWPPTASRRLSRRSSLSVRPAFCLGRPDSCTLSSRRRRAGAIPETMSDDAWVSSLLNRPRNGLYRRYALRHHLRRALESFHARDVIPLAESSTCVPRDHRHDTKLCRMVRPLVDHETTTQVTKARVPNPASRATPAISTRASLARTSRPHRAGSDSRPIAKSRAGPATPAPCRAQYAPPPPFTK